MAAADPPLVAQLAGGVAAIPVDQWDAVAGDADPFVSHCFLSLLEESGSVGPGTGWQPTPVMIGAQGDGGLTAVAPAYIKMHSQGEYVFDHGWAEAWQRAGGQYYPKLQVAVPFTPVPGRRLLAADSAGARQLVAALEAVVDQHDLSSAHATFVCEADIAVFEDAEWLIRRDTQFHWFNRGYDDFDGFLSALSSRKRKAIRRERRLAQAQVRVRSLTGDAIQAADWDVMWACYQDTGARKWGRPYLTRDAFTMMGQRMAHRILLVVADDRATGLPVAAALNFIGKDALYGRYWGALAEVECLHFELCYYQAIDFAIAAGLSRVEAGAQGSHKLARGYEPSATWSAHYIPHPGFRAAVADFLARERPASEQESSYLAEFTPFKKGQV